MSDEEIMNDLQYPTTGVQRDLVEVVRCKDCGNVEVYICRGGGNLYLCNWFESEVMPDEYCSRGERRDG